MIRVFVVILNWNRARDTQDCLKSLSKLNIRDVEVSVVVVDNGSSEKFMIHEPNLQIIRNEENLGFAGGNNVGIKHSLEQGADYIMVLNNDVEVHPELVRELVKVMEEDKRIGAASPKIYFAKGFEFHKDNYKKSDLGKVIWYAGGDIDWDNVYGENRGVDEVDRGQFKKLEKTDFATGACVLLRADAIKQVGMFDEKYFLYLEDADLCMRLKRKKWKVMFVPKAILWHKVSQSSGIGSELNDYYITRNRLLFGFKYAPVRAKFAVLRESLRFLFTGRKWQKIGVRDFYEGKFGKGSWR